MPHAHMNGVGVRRHVRRTQLVKLYGKSGRLGLINVRHMCATGDPS